MTGENKIRFGMSDYGSSKGFPIRDFTKFSKEIDINSIYAELGGEDKIPPKMKACIDSIFFDITGGNSSIEKNKLIQYFKALDNAAEDDDLLQVDRETLDHSELYNMEAKRGIVKEQQTILGIPVNVDKESREFIGKFVKALVNVNDKTYEKEQAVAKDLASRTTIDKNGNRVVKEKNGSISTYDKNNNLLTVKSFNKDVTKTEFYKDYHVVKSVEESKTYRKVTNYNKDQNPVKETYFNKRNKSTITKNRSYDNSGMPVQKVEKSSDYVETTLYKNGYPKKVVITDKDGTITENYYKPNSYIEDKMVQKDKNNNVIRTVLYKNTKEGIRMQEEVLDEKGEILEIADYDYKKGGKHTRTTEFHKDGKTIIKFNAKERETKREDYDINGKLTTVKETFYDASGRAAKFIKKDADGAILETSTITYPSKSSSKTEVRDGNGELSEIRTSNWTGDAHNGTIESYQNDKLLCSWETDFKKHVDVFKDSQGNLITRQEYKEILKQRSQDR